jgi:proteasome alpha subunit
MSYNFYDFNNALQQRNEYVEDRLRDGSPVVGLSYDGGMLLLSLKHSQRKVYEIYDKLMLGAMGKQSDIESIRLAAIDAAHREGFQRSEDDVSVQRLVGFGLSPAVKRVYNDNNTIPLTFRGLFAELNATPADDLYFTLGYDGEFRNTKRYAVVAGTTYASEQAEESLKDAHLGNLEDTVKAALRAWGIARTQLAPLPEKLDDDGEEITLPPTPEEILKTAFEDGMSVEAAILDRHTKRESRFRLLRADEIPAL